MKSAFSPPVLFSRMRILLSLILAIGVAGGFELPATSQQCVVGIAPDWNSSKVTVAAYERQGNQWRQVMAPWPGRLGKNGLVWGLGLHPDSAGVKKKEGDGRAPAGVFRIGGAWGYDAHIRKHPKLFYRQISTRDLWVEDIASPSYNRHLVLDHEPSTAWEKKQQMRQNDHAHSLKLFIGHNSPPEVTKGGGSAIFFHIWRGGGSKPTAGCTTMPEERLRELIAWIDPDKQPLYVLLPREEYEGLREAWNLP